MSPHKKTGLRSEDTMDEDSDDKDSKRKSRNLSEKKRRDQFNLLVNELSALVSTGGKKMDKSSVLRATISFLKNHNEISIRSKINEIQEDWKPSFLTNEEFTHLVLEAVDGFIIVFSSTGQIHYTSESITSLLGYLPKHIVKMTIYELTIEEDQSIIYNVIAHPAENKSQVAFSCHLKRSSPDSEKQETCDLVNFVGYFRADDDMSNKNKGQSSADERLVFVGTGRIQTPLLLKDIPVVDSNKSEFISRHSLEWKFLFLDHRAPPIIGYLPFEVLGTSGYEYYHIDDLDKVISCHESLMQKGEGTSCYYRFLTKGQQWIWLQTRFYITYHQWNSKPEFVVCTHRVVSYVDVMKEASQDMSQYDEWRDSRGVKRAFADSECDSPASKKSQNTMADQVQQYLEPPQFVAVPLLGSYPRVVSPIVVDNSMPQQNQIQVDLQRKQAELQAIIGQQQQELRRVSEQLLMARLGIYQQQATSSYQPAGSVSSTTSSAAGSSTLLVASPLTVPVAVAHPSSMMYNPNQHGHHSERN